MTFEFIYLKFKDQVYNLALHYVQHTEEAQEITQDVFVALYQSLDAFRQESQPYTWIYRITINKSLDHIKAKKRKKRFAFLTNLFQEDSNLLLHDRSTFDHPGVLLEQKEALEQIFHHINNLPDNQRTALILARIENKPHAEIGDIMHLSAKAVESLVQRAKVNLQKKLNQPEG